MLDDPTDFPASYATLRTIDESFRCPICKDLVRAPVLLSGCGHSFCSACVRESIGIQPECPQCRAKASVSHVVKNTMMEAAVLAYERAREDILRLVRAEVDAEARRDMSPRKRRRVEPSPIEEDSEVEEIIEIDSKPSRPALSKPASSSGASSGRESEALTECPACHEFVEFADINTHLDNGCVTPVRKKGSTKRAWANIFNGSGSAGPNSAGTSKKAVPLGTGNSPNTPSGRLAAEAYDTLKDKQLRERLQRFELPTTGSRAKLQARHARWVVLYNANLDHAPERQKSISALRAELIAWESGKEKDEREHAKAQERSGFTGGDTTLAADYGKTHQEQFRTLIEQARRTKMQPPKPPGPAEGRGTVAEVEVDG